MICVPIKNAKINFQLLLKRSNSLADPLKRQFRHHAGRWLLLGLSAAVLSTIVLPLNVLTTQRFHHDEALYATWALQIASGTNPWLVQIPIDKPPLFLYTVAGAMWLFGSTEAIARIPSLIATMCTIVLTFRLGQSLYGSGVGLLAAWLAALSPFTILFAPTAFTDPMLAAFIMAGCLAAAEGRAGWAGLWLGLAIATKQQGIFFIPLAVGLLFVAGSRPAGSKVDGCRETVSADHSLSTALYASHPLFYVSRIRPYSKLLLTTALTFLPALFWDMGRSQTPGFWQMSFINYGGLSPVSGELSERWWTFLALLEYATASPTLNLIFIAGLPILLTAGLWQIMKSYLQKSGRILSTHHPQIDWLLSMYVLIFICGHVWFSFQVWDRYLLGLIPILALLMGRIVWLPWRLLRHIWLARQPKYAVPVGLVASLALTCLLTVSLAQPVRDAMNARYPLGSDSTALSGIEQIIAYLQGQVGANNTLYHRWLGPHWRYYLWDYPYDLQYWASPQVLARKARVGHLIAFPSWQSETEVRLALAEAGLGLHPLTRAYAQAGYPSITLYRIEEVHSGRVARRDSSNSVYRAPFTLPPCIIAACYDTDQNARLLSAARPYRPYPALFLENLAD